jgi:dipeptidyl aminopeptidase/acylaminoacyl peptidase
MPTLSPDGNRLAAHLTAQGKDWIGVFDLRRPFEEQQPVMIEWGDYDVIWLRWVGNERILFGLQLLRPLPLFDIEVPVTRAGVIDLRTGATTPLIGGQGIMGDDIIFVDPNGQYVLLSSQESLDDYPSVDRFDLATGRSTRVQSSREGVWNWFADGAGVVRAGVAYDEERVRIYYRQAAGQDLRRVDIQGSSRAGSVIDSIRFAQTGDRGLVVTNEVTGRFAVYDFDFATGARGNAVYEHPEVDVDALIVDEAGQLIGVRYEDDRPRVHWIDPAFGRIQAGIDRALPGKTNTIIDRSTDSNRFLIRSSAADDPGTYLIYDRAAHHMHGFANPYARLTNYSFAPVRQVRYRSRDGIDIPAYLTLPPGRPERGLPLILMPHGGPFYRDSLRSSIPGSSSSPAAAMPCSSPISAARPATAATMRSAATASSAPA